MADSETNGQLTLNDLAAMIRNVGKDVKDVGDQVKMELKADLACLRKEIDDKLASAVNKTATEFSNLTMRQDSLEARVERLDRLSFSSDLLLNGIPWIENENLMDIYSSICTTIGFRAKDYTLLSIFRLKKANQNPTIILKFISPQAKSEFYFCYLKFRKLSLIHLGFETDLRVYVTESLTPINSEYFKFALELRKKGLLHKVYTHNCLVFVKKSSEADPIKISSIQQLQSLSCADSVSNHKRKPSSEPEHASLRAKNDTKIFKSTKSDSTSTVSGSKTPTGSKANPFKMRTLALVASSNPDTNAKSPTWTIERFFKKSTA